MLSPIFPINKNRLLMQTMIHYVYKTRINGTSLYYIGKRSTALPLDEDHYTGSGTLLHDYPKSIRSKEILRVCESEQEAYELEKSLVGDLWKTDPNCLNQKPGGKGAPSGIDHHWFGKPSAYNCRGDKHHAFGKKRTPEEREKIKQGLLQRPESIYLRGENHPGFGKQRSEETKKKLSDKMRGKIMLPFSDQQKKNMSLAATGKSKSIEHRKNLSHALRNRSDEERRATLEKRRKTIKFYLDGLPFASYNQAAEHFSITTHEVKKRLNLFLSPKIC